MINVEMHGRLGNQLFQYATARALQEKVNQPLLFSFRTVISEKDKEGNSGWEDSLKKFKVRTYQTYQGNKPIILVNSSFFQKVIGVFFYACYKPILMKDEYDFKKLNDVQFKWQKILDKIGIWWMNLGYYKYSINLKRKNYILNGGFESEKYFNEIRDKLINEIVPIKALEKDEIELINNLQNRNSVCVTIRHFNLQDKRRENLYKVCDLHYYKNSIERIKSVVENPIFYICSDDQEWVKKNINFGDTKIIYEDNTKDIAIKLYTMTKCRHFIISNSTFSWWAQYLGNYKGKIVVAPKKWYNNDFQSDLVNNTKWIKL